MTKRTEKVESLVRQIVAMAIREHVPNSAQITVTAVDVSPDMRHAIVWLGFVGHDKTEQLFQAVMGELPHIQAAVAKQMTTKFVPKVELRHDQGGEHAEHISRLIKQ